MEKKHLIINIGSASKKYAFYSQEGFLLGAHFEKEGAKFLVGIGIKGEQEKIEISDFDYDNALGYFIKQAQLKGVMVKSEEIEAIAFRVVAPGSYFVENKIIDDRYLEKLKEARERAPLHIVPLLAELDQAKIQFPKALQYAISDSSFYKNLPREAKLYALPKQDAEALEIYRYGYHGLSMKYVLNRLQEVFPKLPEKIIISHLGGGVSVTAVKNGEPCDTSMGFTPLEGVPMGQRIGNIDAGAAIYLAGKLKLGLIELESYFNLKCGLLGLGGSPYVKELIELEKEGNKDARVALDFFAYGIKKYIGAYMAALGGLDLLVFTATIGERSSFMRAKICRGLEGLGIAMDKNKNEFLGEGVSFIELADSGVKIAVLATDEMSQMETELKLINKNSFL